MKSAIFLANGFEECEALITVDIFRRADLVVDMISIQQAREVCGSHGIHIMADKTLPEMDQKEYDVLLLPGGKVGKENLENNPDVKEAIITQVQSDRWLGAICAAPAILGHMGLLKGKKYTCFPTFDEAAFGGTYQEIAAAQDGKLVTGRGMGATMAFAYLLLKNFVDSAVLKQVAYGMQYSITKL